ncbi:MAG: preprotein translocase subunit YajC [Ruminococcaceae bacterium]|nr:preprotein translocase subunit YajC [Oscillospiraceae bacterium]
MGNVGTLAIYGVMILMIVGMMWFSSRSQKRQEREINEMRDGLQVGDEITTIGGIIGKIVSIKEETCLIETGRDKTRIRILKSAVKTVDVKAEDAQP